MGLTVVGGDLSLTASGIAHEDGHLSLVGASGITNMSVAQQILALDSLAHQVLDAIGRPDLVVLEALDMARSYGGQVERTVLWWKVAETLHGWGVPVVTPTSAQVKIYATGNGLAKKPQMLQAVTTLWPWHRPGSNDNLADAAAMAELGKALLGQPSIELPTLHTRVLQNVRRLSDPPSRVTKKAKQ